MGNTWDKSSTLEMVRQFHQKFKQPEADGVNIDNSELNELRVELIREELEELEEALAERSAVEVLDALADLQYVLDGAFLALGYGRVKVRAVLEVHRSNMSKLGRDGKPVLREDGKILKGPGYTPPDLAKVMAVEA